MLRKMGFFEALECCERYNGDPSLFRRCRELYRRKCDETEWLTTQLKACEKALDALTQGSTIRVYGASFISECGERRKSIALTDEQRKLLREAMVATDSFRSGGAAIRKDAVPTPSGEGVLSAPGVINAEEF